MGKLALYYHYRNDGGTRTTVDVDGVTVAHRFKAGKRAVDPTLAWYVDVRCEGVRLPKEPAAALQWLHDKSELIRAGLADFAANINVDPDAEPIRWEIAGSQRGVRISLFAWAQTAKGLVRMPRMLGKIRDRWDDLLGELEPSLSAAS
jgi:hypothetical protein